MNGNLRQSADIKALRMAWSAQARMRTGRKLGRTLYLETPGDPDHDLCVGIVDDDAFAEEIVRRWNEHVF